MSKGDANTQTMQSLAAADLRAALDRVGEALGTSESAEDIYTQLTDAIDIYVEVQREKAHLDGYDGLRLE